MTSIKLLTPVGMVDNLAEKVDKCPLNHCNVYNWECKIITLYGVEWDVRYLRVSNAIEKRSGLFRIVCYIMSVLC